MNQTDHRPSCRRSNEQQRDQQCIIEREIIDASTNSGRHYLGRRIVAAVACAPNQHVKPVFPQRVGADDVRKKWSRTDYESNSRQQEQLSGRTASSTYFIRRKICFCTRSTS